MFSHGTNLPVDTIPPLITKILPLWQHKTLVSASVGVAWSVLMDFFDKLIMGSWIYDVAVHWVSGVVLGTLVWYALTQECKHDQALVERYHLCRKLAHHISNPVQTLLNREHLPVEHRERLVNQAIDELVEACRDIIPRIMSPI